jgi:hypothetical protein
MKGFDGSGAVRLIARSTARATSRHVGHELDVRVTHTLMRQLQLAGGYVHLFAGNVVREATPGASYSHPYVMATYIFFSER